MILNMRERRPRRLKDERDGTLWIDSGIQRERNGCGPWGTWGENSRVLVIGPPVINHPDLKRRLIGKKVLIIRNKRPGEKKKILSICPILTIYYHNAVSPVILNGTLNL